MLVNYIHQNNMDKSNIMAKELKKSVVPRKSSGGVLGGSSQTEEELNIDDIFKLMDLYFNQLLS